MSNSSSQRCLEINPETINSMIFYNNLPTWNILAFQKAKKFTVKTSFKQPLINMTKTGL